MTRLQQILIAVLVVQLALAGVAFWPRSTAGASGAALFPGLKAEDITAITISEKTGTSTKLVRQGEGWVLPDAGNFPADAEKIKTLTGKLVELKSNRLVTKTPGSHARLQVADNDFAERVDFQTAGGSHSLFLGTMSGGTSAHVRVSGQNEVYLSNLSTWELKSDVTTWINPTYFSVPSADVTAVTVKNASGDLAFSKDAQGKWQLQGLAAGEALNANIESLVSTLSSLNMARPLGKQDQASYGLAKPSAVVTVTTKKDNQEKTHTLTIGAKDGDTYVVKSSESEYYVKVNDYSVNDIVTRKRADYIQQPTPAPGATGTPGAGK